MFYTCKGRVVYACHDVIFNIITPIRLGLLSRANQIAVTKNTSHVKYYSSDFSSDLELTILMYDKSEMPTQKLDNYKKHQIFQNAYNWPK